MQSQRERAVICHDPNCASFFAAHLGKRNDHIKRLPENASQDINPSIGKVLESLGILEEAFTGLI